MSQLRRATWAVSERLNICCLDCISSMSKRQQFFFKSQNGTSSKHSVFLKRTSRTVLKMKNLSRAMKSSLKHTSIHYSSSGNLLIGDYKGQVILEPYLGRKSDFTAQNMKECYKLDLVKQYKKSFINIRTKRKYQVSSIIIQGGQNQSFMYIQFISNLFARTSVNPKKYQNFHTSNYLEELHEMRIFLHYSALLISLLPKYSVLATEPSHISSDDQWLFRDIK